MADGRKVRDSYGSYPTKPTTPLDTVINNTDPYITGINDWSEDYYYAAGKLRRVTTLDGYLNLYNRTKYRNYYAVKDHIGCTWEYEKGSKKAFGYPSYYPSGIMDRKPYATYPFGLGGKEFMGTNYLDKYFFGARTMYAIMNRFNQVDPLCEEYYSVSPYAYALNNPVRYIDLDGKDGWDVVTGYGIGLITNVIPGSGDLRDSYTPRDPTDYNNALQGIDNASVLLGAGMIKTGGTGIAVGTGAVAIGVTVSVGSGGTLAVDGLPVAAGGTLIEAGAVTAGTGAVLMSNGKQNQDAGYNRGKNGTQPKSINQLNQDVKKGKSLQGITRFDIPKDTKGGQDHVHFKNGAALNKSGEWKDGSYKMNKEQKEYLIKNGWTIDK